MQCHQQASEFSVSHLNNNSDMSDNVNCMWAIHNNLGPGRYNACGLYTTIWVSPDRYNVNALNDIPNILSRYCRNGITNVQLPSSVAGACYLWLGACAPLDNHSGAVAFATPAQFGILLSVLRAEWNAGHAGAQEAIGSRWYFDVYGR